MRSLMIVEDVNEENDIEKDANEGKDTPKDGYGGKHVIQDSDAEKDAAKDGNGRKDAIAKYKIKKEREWDQRYSNLYLLVNYVHVNNSILSISMNNCICDLA